MVNPSGSAIVNNFTIIINRLLEQINRLDEKVSSISGTDPNRITFENLDISGNLTNVNNLEVLNAHIHNNLNVEEYIKTRFATIEVLEVLSAHIHNNLEVSSINKQEYSGNKSAAFGHDTEAIGENSAAFGQYTKADRENSVAFGQYNHNSNALFVIGNGKDDNTRSDAFVLDNDNLNINTTLDISGNVTINANLDVKQTITTTHLNVNRIRNNNNGFKSFILPADESNETRYSIYDDNHFIIHLGQYTTDIHKEFQKIIEDKLILFDLTPDDVFRSDNPSLFGGLTNFQIKLDLPDATDNNGNVIIFDKVAITSVDISSDIVSQYLIIETTPNLSSNSDGITSNPLDFPLIPYHGNCTFTQISPTINIGQSPNDKPSNDYISIEGKDGLFNFTGNLTINAGKLTEVVRELVDISSNIISLNGENTELNLATEAKIIVNRQTTGKDHTISFSADGTNTNFDHSISVEGRITTESALIADATIESAIIADATIQNDLKVNGNLATKDDLFMGRSIMYDEGFIGLATHFSGMTELGSSYLSLCSFSVDTPNYDTSISVRIHYSTNITNGFGNKTHATGVAYGLLQLPNGNGSVPLHPTEDLGSLDGASFSCLHDHTNVSIRINTAGNEMRFSGKIELLSSWGQISLLYVNVNSRS